MAQRKRTNTKANTKTSTRAKKVAVKKEEAQNVEILSAAEDQLEVVQEAVVVEAKQVVAELKSVERASKKVDTVSEETIVEEAEKAEIHAEEVEKIVEEAAAEQLAEAEEKTEHTASAKTKKTETETKVKTEGTAKRQKTTEKKPEKEEKTAQGKAVKKENAVQEKEKPDYSHEFDERMAKYYEELKWLYCELYPNQRERFEELCTNLKGIYEARKESLKDLDRVREKNPSWYKKNDLLGMMMYVDAFAENLNGVREKLDYIEECRVNYLHLMPLLETPEGRSDGGYAVANFRKVQENLGTMDDLANLADECHKKGISVCLDFVMNHTSEDHEWAMRARGGDREYQDRYFFYDSYDIPAQYEKTVPQVFPTTAPGNFTWLPDVGKFVMTTFYPYQWDLNYGNPVVLNEMIYNMLYLTNQGIDIIRIDAVPYIWKQLGTNCRNLPQVHSIVRMMRMICEIVCPGVLLLGEVVMEPKEVVPYFGSVEKPECHMLYNVTTMATTWHSVATRDVRLLKYQMDIVDSLPKDYVFLNYLRCHDDIGWGLDYKWLSQFGIQEVPHKKYLNDFLTGKYPGSFGRGELYNSDPLSGDARLCGTTASLCGTEKAVFERDDAATDQAVKLDLMLHAYMLTQSGIPVLYSGDEIGQLNDYDYHNDPHRWDDSRYLHRGKFQWALAQMREDEKTRQGKMFQELKKMEQIRASHSVFESDAAVWTIDTWDDSILGLVRADGEEKLVALFNFSEYGKVAWINEDDGIYTDLLSGQEMEAKGVLMPPYGAYWLLKK